MFPSESDIAAAKAKSSVCHLLEYDDGASAVIAKQPSSAEWNRLTTVIGKDSSAAGRATEDFARACIMWPERAALDAIVAERPALLARFGNELADLAGASEKIRAKKL